MNMSRQPLMTLAVMILGSIATAPARSTAQLTQTDFGLELPMARTVRVPPAVLRQLAAHDDTREFLDGQRELAADVLGAYEATPITRPPDRTGRAQSQASLRDQLPT